MRIGLFLECVHDSGGGFQQSLSTIELLSRSGKTKHEFAIFTPFEETRRLLLQHGFEAIQYTSAGFRLIDRWSSTTVGGAILRRLRRLGLRRIGRHLDAVLDDHRIDLALFNEIGEGVWRIGDHPFIVTVWDLDHRDAPEFPESYADRVFERRERDLQVTLTRAMAVITNSPTYVRQLASLYHVDPRRIVELPFVPSLAVRRHAAGVGTETVEGVRRKYTLPDRYIFYPAYFSYHKNHLYILDGLIELERRYGIVLDAVFCGGGDPCDQPVVERQVVALGLTSRIRFLGLVPDEDVPALYQGALALVMPAYFAGTNLPPLEASVLGCPVIYSDLPGCREQMGDAALYCDLAAPASLADHLKALIQDPAVTASLRDAGARLATETANIDYGERLAQILDDYEYVQRRWAWPAE